MQSQIKRAKLMTIGQKITRTCISNHEESNMSIFISKNQFDLGVATKQMHRQDRLSNLCILTYFHDAFYAYVHHV